MPHHSHPMRRGITALVATSVLLSACTTYPLLELRRAQTAADVGEVHVAVLSVVPFEAVSASLSPDFSLTGKDAQNEALVTTQATQRLVDRSTQMLLGVSVPGADAPASAASATQVSPPDLPATSASAPALGAVTQHNAMLRYQLAASLYQEVQLLNNYVRDARRADGFEPYIVRLQVTVRPLARATPYDAVAKLQFENTRTQGLSGPLEGPKPIVVPLLVADTQDATAVSSLDRHLQQLGLAISALKGAFGLTGTFNRQMENVVSSLGWQYQSVSNVARETDQTLSVRLSAQPTGVNRFELLPRVHNVTVMLLVPRSPSGTASALECPPAGGLPSRRPFIDVPYTVSHHFIHATEGGSPTGSTARQESFQVRAWGTPVLPPSGQHAPLSISGSADASFKADLLLRGGAHLTEQTVHGARAASAAGSAPAWTIHAQDVSVAEKSGRTALKISFTDLSAADLDLLKTATRLQLIPATEVCREDGALTASAVTLDITPSPLNAPKDTPKPTVTFKTDPFLPVSPSGQGQLSLAAKFKKDSAPHRVAVAFQAVLPHGPLGFDGTAGCARIEAHELVFTGTCNVTVRLRSLPPANPVIGGAAPTLAIAATEVTQAGADPIKTELPAVPLQHKPPSTGKSKADAS